ncbi:hypothetical protein C0V97_12975 [Asaia sp. W19]|nr:hypothetical protein C0V97_12975 [Asaia sp. W19]
MIVHETQHIAQSERCTSLIAPTGPAAPPAPCSPASPLSPAGSQAGATPGLHASCAHWQDMGVVLTGPSGSGKSSLLLRLIDSGFDLVGDDRILIEAGMARPEPRLAGLIEVRGLGILRMPHQASTAVKLWIELVENGPVTRLPEMASDPQTGAWMIRMNGFQADAVAIIRSALRCINGELTLLCGVNGATPPVLPLPMAPEAR